MQELEQQAKAVKEKSSNVVEKRANKPHPPHKRASAD
jgi:hypothetical protein